MVNRRNLPTERFKVKVFTGASVEGDVNAWLDTNPGVLLQMLLSQDATNPVVMALYRPSQ